MKQDRKKTAAIAAVAAYIKSQEEAAVGVAPEPVKAAAAEMPETVLPAAAIPVWRVSGRQHQMQLRNLMQMKALQRATGWRR